MTQSNKKIFAVLFFSIFSAVSGIGIIVPILPVYANNLGATGVYIGAIFASFSLSRTFFLPIFGRLSDKYGRKPFITTGLFFYFIISIAFIFFETVNGIIIIRFLQGIASGMIMPVAQAYAGDITPKNKEGFVMGIFNMSMFFGLSIGPVLGGIISGRYGLNAAFICMGLLVFIGFILSFFMLPKTKNEKMVDKKKLVSWKSLITDRDIAAIFIFRFTFTICLAIIIGFIPVFADTNLSLSSSYIGILVTTGIFVSGIIHVPMGYVADRFNKKILIITGGLIISGSVFFLANADSFKSMMIANTIFGLGAGISMPAVFAIAILKGSKTESMGTVIALLTVGHSLGMTIGPMMAGLFMDIFSLRYVFHAASAAMLIGTIAFLLLSSNLKPEIIEKR
jgi:MFS transporter, DHA1 family, multidrug resistance protein